MTARKTSKAAPAAKKSGKATKAPARKKTSGSKAAAKPAARKTAAKPARKAAAKPKAPPKKAPEPAPRKDREAPPPKPAAKAAAKPAGKISASDVNLGHVFALRPRVSTTFKQSDFLTARHLLQDEGWQTIQEAARAVAEKALALTNEARSKRGFKPGR